MTNSTGDPVKPELEAQAQQNDSADDEPEGRASLNTHASKKQQTSQQTLDDIPTLTELTPESKLEIEGDLEALDIPILTNVVKHDSSESE